MKPGDLLSEAVVKYFIHVSQETNTNITLICELKDIYADRSLLEDKIAIPWDAMPREITIEYILEISRGFKELMIPLITAQDRGLRVYSLHVSMWVEAVGHNEKVYGFRELELEKEEEEAEQNG